MTTCLDDLFRAAHCLTGSTRAAAAAVEACADRVARRTGLFTRPDDTRAGLFAILLREIRSLHQDTETDLTDSCLLALHRLPRAEAETVLLADVFDFPLPEIKKITGWADGQIRSNLAAGRAGLRRALAVPSGPPGAQVQRAGEAAGWVSGSAG